MKTKHLLTGLVLPALFAACTAEEIESSKGVMTQEDLSARPSVGNVVLNFGDIDSRAELGNTAFNSINFNADEDRIGARIIDTYSATGLKDAYGERVAWSHYSIVNDYASSNYEYVWDGDQWNTTALMVEGNYMFYYPYNKKNVARGPLEIITPTHQTVKPNEKDGDRNAIAELYAGENPAFVGYKFIDAKDQGLSVSVDMQHLFAYPQVTLVNDFTVRSNRTDVETDLVITKIVLSSSKIYEKYVVNHTNFQTNLTPEFTYLEKKTDKKETPLIPAGDWTEAETLLKNATIETIAEAKGKNVEITVEFEDGLELAYGEEYSFNIVLPASAYAAGDLTMQVYTEDDMMIGTTSGAPKSFSVAKDMTFAPGKRYATQEYNFPAKGTPSPKKAAGSLATYELGGKNLELIDAVAPVAVINTIEEFEAYLESIDENVETLAEIAKINDRKADENNFILAPALDEKGNELCYANLVIDEAFLALLDEYNYAGEISFLSNMKVVGAEEAPNADKEIEAFTLGNKDYKMNFKSVKITEGYVTVDAAMTAEELIVSDGVLTIEDATIDAVNVIGGEAIVTYEEFKTSVITAGHKLNDAKTAEISEGKVTLNYNGETAAPAVDGGILVIGNKVKVDNVNAWSVGDITNNGTIIGGLTVENGVNLTNNGKMEGDVVVKTYGKIYANANTTVKQNAGLIVVGDDLVDVTITDATVAGKINNTEGGKVYGVYADSNKQDVYATLTSLENNGEGEDLKLSSKYDYHSGVTKYILTGVWSVDEVTEGPEQQIYAPNTTETLHRTIEFAAGSSLKIASGAELTLTGDVVIAANVTWSGRNATASVLNIGTNDIEFMQDANGVFYNVVVKDLTTDKNPQEFLVRDALAKGGKATINDNITLGQNASFTKTETTATVLDLNGKTIENDYSDVFVVEAGNLTIQGNGTVKAAMSNTASACAVWVKGNPATTSVTIKNGTFKTGGDNDDRNDLIYVGAKASPALGGKVIIEDGYFEYTGAENADYQKDGNYWLLNCNDNAYLYKNAKIEVLKGTFRNFNPAFNYAESAEGKTSFLAEGKTVKAYHAGTTTEITDGTAGVAYETAWTTNVDFKVVNE